MSPPGELARLVLSTLIVLIRVAAAFVLVAGLASPAFANQIQVGYSGSGYGPHQTGLGGEFTLNIVGGTDLSVDAYHDDVSGFGSITSFQSFCIEMNEYLYPYANVYDVAISAAAVNGGAGGPSPDPISAGTAYLYSQFALGDLDGYAFDGTTAQRKASAAALQQAIWWLEEELSLANPGTNAFLALLTAGPTPLFTTFTDARQNATGDRYGVSVLNLTQGTVKRQDQLYFAGITQADVSVPDGGTTMALLGMGLLGLGVVARRIRSSGIRQ